MAPYPSLPLSYAAMVKSQSQTPAPFPPLALADAAADEVRVIGAVEAEGAAAAAI